MFTLRCRSSGFAQFIRCTYVESAFAFPQLGKQLEPTWLIALTIMLGMYISRTSFRRETAGVGSSDLPMPHCS